MDFQYLRKIQKKERDKGTLTRVEETFYSDIQVYLKELKQSAIDNPFSDVYNTLHESRRIATEICEIRDHKISNAAVLNIHRSFPVFTGKDDFDLLDSMPLNLTPEEETFYFSLIETLKNHRSNLSGNDDEVVKKIQKPKIDNQNEDKKEDVIEKENASEPLTEGEDEVVNRLDEISKAKVITDEVREPIEAQISKKPKPKAIDDISDILSNDDDSQFVDLDSQKRIKDAEIVTMLIFDDINPIVGIDEKIYGPFRSQDIVMLPRINANIFARARKGRFVKI